MSQNHLLRRGGVFYYRRRVPLSLVKAVGKKIVIFSLGTGDPKLAKKRRDLEDLKWNARFESVASGSPDQANNLTARPSSMDLIRLVGDYVERTDRRSKDRQLADPPDGMEQKAAIKMDAEMAREMLTNPDDPRGLQMIHATRTSILGNTVSKLPEANSAIFAEIVRRGLLELQNRNIARLEDDFGRPFFDPTFSPQSQAEATFGQVSDQFLQLTDEQARANGTSQKWVDKQSANVATLKEIVGQAIRNGKSW